MIPLILRHLPFIFKTLKIIGGAKRRQLSLGFYGVAIS
ncbi:hypothetical protein Pse7429DRAFT_2853 [Pseudanabaena biceps PCC 7429]|uniref:Uncharacterized protein n=1 Tax=Pseudanabaena biceps PCC 7429 TaxID=927668 RepID=L8MUW0_9CYAN|nr:hypothetical protein Pse7429DRAFT_2853 [Pseudanabaena biceps PCC 7429]